MPESTALAAPAKTAHTAADLSPEDRARLFTESLADCRDMLMGVIRRAAADAEAEDLLQTAVAAAWARFPQFRFESKVSTWLCAFTIRVCMAHVSSKKLVYLDDWSPCSDAHQIKLVGGQPPEPELQLIAARLAENVSAALAALPPLDSKIVRLNLLEGLSTSEIAIKLGLPRPAVSRRLTEGRACVRRALGSES